MEEVGEGRQELRVILKNFLSIEECKELEFIHKSCSTVGYRPNVFSTTLLHLVATNSAHLIMPLVPIRERLKEKAEEFFGCEYELFVEFTGLISWTRGASIGWHSDDNRPYLKQRDFAAVCYLNNYGVDFKGGLFHFQDGEPTTIMPFCGDCVMYSADGHNIHSVDEITDGERLTLTLWFSRDSSHDEDKKLVSLLSQSPLRDHLPYSCLPLPASTNMYWFSPEQDSNFKSGFDVCWARLHALGYGIYQSQDSSSSDFSELLVRPLQLVRGNELLDQEFVNILHALQVVQFHYWKAVEVDSTKFKGDLSKVVSLTQIENEKISHLKSVFTKDEELAESIFGRACNDGQGQTGQKPEQQRWLGWFNFAAAAVAWEYYASNLGREILRSLPHWKANQSIFTVS